MAIEDIEPLYNVAKDQEIWLQHPMKRYLREEFDKYFEESIDSKGALVILDKVSDLIIGSSRFKIIDGFPNYVEIGWTFLAREYWGGTYNQSVKSLMINHAFNYVENIVFYINKYNIRSMKAIEKINGEKVNIQILNLPKINPNNLIYLITKDKWTA